MLSGKRPYWKIAMLLSSSLIFLLGACGDVVTEEEIAGEEGKGDTQTGILSKSYSNLDPQYGLVSNPNIISIPERGRATAIRVTANVSFYFDGYFIQNGTYYGGWGFTNYGGLGVSANDTLYIEKPIIRNGEVLGNLTGQITANCQLKKTDYRYTQNDVPLKTSHYYYSDGPCEHTGTLTLTLPGNNQLINGEWKLDSIIFTNGGGYKAADDSRNSVPMVDLIREINSNWTLDFDYIPTLTSQHKNTSRLHLPDADKQYEAYSTMNIPQIYSGPLSGGLSGLLINVDIAHKDPKDLVIKLEHNEKAVTLLELAKATQVQNGLQRRFSLSDVPELSTFVGEDIVGEWRLWLVDESRGYEGDLNWWSLELTPSASSN